MFSRHCLDTALCLYSKLPVSISLVSFLSPATNPCLPGGTCVFTKSGVTCDCLDGYSGTTCKVSPASS